jgi:hypothetical protein
MSIDFQTPWGAVINGVVGIIDRIIPDPAARAAAQLQVMQLAQTEQLAELKAQVDLAVAQANTNTAEAANPNLFTSGWRPGAGWTCSLGLFYQFLLQPLMSWGSVIWHIPAPPAIDLGTLITLLGGMLGLGTLRTAEKIQGVTK